MFGSCGLENYVYLNPVVDILKPLGGIGTIASITFPSQQPQDEFRNYMIFYRIYLSDEPVPPTFTGVPSQLIPVNTELANHYSFLERYTSDDTISAVPIDSIFRNRGYFPIYASPDGVIVRPLQNILYTASGTIHLSFFSDPYPSFLDTFNIKYFLFRASNTSRPDRTFNYSSQLNNDTNIDVQQNTGTGTTNCAYVSMYIVATGIDGNYTPLFSRPTHIGIFPLP